MVAVRGWVWIFSGIAQCTLVEMENGSSKIMGRTALIVSQKYLAVSIFCKAKKVPKYRFLCVLLQMMSKQLEPLITSGAHISNTLKFLSCSSPFNG